MITLSRALVVLFLAFIAGATVEHARALEPGEMLSDPALEARARDISAGLRCLVCQNQSIDDSDAELARDLRSVVRQRLLAGDSNEEVLKFVVDRYGTFVLLKPPLSPSTALLWLMPLLLIIPGIFFYWQLRRKGREQAIISAPLSPEERQDLKRILEAEKLN